MAKGRREARSESNGRDEAGMLHGGGARFGTRKQENKNKIKKRQRGPEDGASAQAEREPITLTGYRRWTQRGAGDWKASWAMSNR